MTLKIFPTLPGLTYPVLRTASFDTLSQVSPNKYETDIPQTVNPLWSWQLVYDFLRDFPYASFTISELRTLQDFFLYHQGRAGVFLFLDPDDNYVGPAMVGGSPNTPLAQLAVVNDGAGNYYSPLQRTLGGLFYEDVTDLNTDSGAGGSTLAIYANGTLQTTASYTLASSPGLALPTVSYMGLYIKWTGINKPSAAPTLTSVAGGSLAARTAWVTVTYTTSPGGETLASTEASIALSANTLLVVDSPPSETRAAGWNVYVSETASGGEQKQNSTAIAIGTNWTEPTSGLISGAAAPTIDSSALPATPVTAQFNFYFRARFETDAQDFEKFLNGFWTVGGSESQKGSGQIKLQQARPNPL